MTFNPSLKSLTITCETGENTTKTIHIMYDFKTEENFRNNNLNYPNKDLISKLNVKVSKLYPGYYIKPNSLVKIMAL